MNGEQVFVLHPEQTQWQLHTESQIAFSWQYDDLRAELLRLYARGKQKQWDAESRIDWDRTIDPENPALMDDAVNVSIFGSDVWERMTLGERAALRRHIEGWRTSQILHGEQGALLCAAKLVQTVPDIDAKFFAATQVIDEARHVEVYRRYLAEKVEVAYPIDDSLRTLLAQILTDSRWDYTYLGMQVLIEGLAMAVFSLMSLAAKNPLVKQINSYVVRDEARHVAFGRVALRDYYQDLSELERSEREEFVIQVSALLRDRFRGAEVWDRLGLPTRECLEFVEHSPTTATFRIQLFSHIVPILKQIGLFGEQVQRAYWQMGLLPGTEIGTVGDVRNADGGARPHPLAELREETVADIEKMKSSGEERTTRPAPHER